MRVPISCAMEIQGAARRVRWLAYALTPLLALLLSAALEIVR